MKHSKRNAIMSHLETIWDDLSQYLTESQFETCLANGVSIRDRASLAFELSQNKTVQNLALRIMDLYDSHFGTIALTVSNKDFSEFD